MKALSNSQPAEGRSALTRRDLLQKAPGAVAGMAALAVSGPVAAAPNPVTEAVSALLARVVPHYTEGWLVVRAEDLQRLSEVAGVKWKVQS